MNKINEIANIIEQSAESLLTDDGVDRQVCLEIAKNINDLLSKKSNADTALAFIDEAWELEENHRKNPGWGSAKDRIHITTIHAIVHALLEIAQQISNLKRR
jgi:hypothetical protein